MPQGDSDILHTTAVKLRNILFAHVTGLLVFAGVAIALRIWNSHSAPNDDLLTWAAIAIPGILLLLQFVVPSVLLRWIARQYLAPPPGESVEILVNAYRLHLRVAWGLCQGAACTCLAAYMLMGNPAFLLVAGVTIMLMIDRFPTETAFASWVERPQREYAAEYALQR